MEKKNSGRTSLPRKLANTALTLGLAWLAHHQDDDADRLTPEINATEKSNDGRGIDLEAKPSKAIVARLKHTRDRIRDIPMTTKVNPVEKLREEFSSLPVSLPRLKGVEVSPEAADAALRPPEQSDEASNSGPDNTDLIREATLERFKEEFPGASFEGVHTAVGYGIRSHDCNIVIMPPSSEGGGYEFNVGLGLRTDVVADSFEEATAEFASLSEADKLLGEWEDRHDGTSFKAFLSLMGRDDLGKYIDNEGLMEKTKKLSLGNSGNSTDA